MNRFNRLSLAVIYIAIGVPTFKQTPNDGITLIPGFSCFSPGSGNIPIGLWVGSKETGINAQNSVHFKG